MKFTLLSSLALASLVKRDTAGINAVVANGNTAFVTVTVVGQTVSVSASFITVPTSSVSSSAVISSIVTSSTTSVLPSSSAIVLPSSSSSAIPDIPEPEVPDININIPETPQQLLKRQLIGENIIYLSPNACVGTQSPGSRLTAAGAVFASGAQSLCTSLFPAAVLSITVQFADNSINCVNVNYAPVVPCPAASSSVAPVSSTTSAVNVNVDVTVNIVIGNYCNTCAPITEYYLYPYYCQVAGPIFIYGYNYVCGAAYQYIYVTRQYVLGPGAVTVITVPSVSTQAVVVPATVTIQPTVTITGRATTAPTTPAVTTRPILTQVNQGNKAGAGFLVALFAGFFL